MNAAQRRYERLMADQAKPIDPEYVHMLEKQERKKRQTLTIKKARQKVA